MKFLQFLLKILNIFEDHSGRLPPSRSQSPTGGLTLAQRQKLRQVVKHHEDKT
jgi:hypothetical protein